VFEFGMQCQRRQLVLNAMDFLQRRRRTAGTSSSVPNTGVSGMKLFSSTAEVSRYGDSCHSKSKAKVGYFVLACQQYTPRL
jgi:hypothetical protein